MQDSKNIDSFFIDEAALKGLKLVAVAYSFVDRADFATEGAYHAEVEVEERAEDVIKEITKLGINVKGYAADKYFFTNILVDKPDLVLNIVDKVRGEDKLQPAIPEALELSDMKYTGHEMHGLWVCHDRHLF